MFKRIMVPVDLGHVDSLGKALKTAADLSRHYGIPAVYVGVTPNTPGPIAHNPQEYAQKLEAFCQAEASRHGHEALSKPVIAQDPTSDLDDHLGEALEEIGADLVVMQSHVPNISDRLWPSHGGSLATHTQASVLLVR